jgi:MFS family permease
MNVTTTAAVGAQTVPRSYENRLVFILALGGAVSALDAQSLFYLSPFVASSLELNNTQIGLVSSVVLLSWSIAGYLVGTWSDRSGRRKPWLVGTFILFAACSFLTGLATSFLMLFAARLLIGLAEGPVIPVSQSIMIRNSSPHRRGLNMGIVQNFGAQLIGTLVAPILLVQIAERFNWHAAFYVAGVPALIVALLIAWFVKEPPRENLAASNAPADSGSGIMHLLRIRNLRLCVLISCCVVLWYFTLLTFLPLYCVRVLKISATTMSYVMGAMGAAGVVSAFMVPALSDRFGRKRMITLFVLLSIAAPLAALFAGSSLPLLMAGVFLGSLVLGTAPLFMAVVPLESVSAHDAAAATGLVMAIGQIVGGFGGPTLGGVLADQWGLAVPLWIVVGATIAGTLISTRLIETAPRMTKAASV